MRFTFLFMREILAWGVRQPTSDRTSTDGLKNGIQDAGDRRRMQETGDRMQETGDRMQETGDRRQETGDRRREMGHGTVG